MHSFSKVICLAVISCIACVSVPVRAKEDESRVKAQLVAQAAAWDKAIVAKERGAIEANMAASFFNIGASATTADHDTFVNGLIDPDLILNPYEVQELEVHLYGDTAQLTGTMTIEGTYKGKPFSTRSRYIDTYVRDATGWHVVSVQLTPFQSSS